MNFLESINNYLNYLKLKKKNKKKTIYFYSEGASYRNYLITIIEKLIKYENLQILYFTSDKNDLDFIDNKIKPIFIGDGIIRRIFFAKLNCDIMVMTLTDLNNHEIIKSKNCKSYAYVFHSLVSTHKAYNKNSFYNYDLIFSNGRYQERELKKTENLYKLNNKEIHNTGYPYFDYLKKNIVNNSSDNSILFAPSWSKFKDDLIDKHAYHIIKNLLKHKKIIFRPHPQSLIKSREKINKIIQNFKKEKNFSLNLNITDIEPLNKSSALIVDSGGMGMEYTLMFGKPVIYINYKDKIHNDDFKKINIVPIEEIFKRNFGYILDIDQIIHLNDKIEFAVKDFKNKQVELKKFIDEYQILIENPSSNIVDVILKKLNI